MKTITAKSKKQEARKAANKAAAAATAPKAAQVKEATAPELRRAALVMRGMGDEAGAGKLEAKADAMKPARVPAAAKEPRPTCTGTKKDGTACTAKAKEGQVTCVDHTPAYDRMDAIEQGAFAHWYKEQSAATIANFIGWHAAMEIVRKETK